MANQIIFSATITPANTAMEVTINGGTTFTDLAFTTVGGVQQGTLTGVPSATYSAGQLIMRCKTTTSVSATNLGQVTVAAVDVAAQAAATFISAAGLTVQAQKDAITQLCVDFQAAGFFAAGKSYAYWPVVGGTANAHSRNLFNPSLFQIDFTTSVATHDAFGFVPSATAVASTNFLGSRDWVGNTLSLAYYSRTQSAVDNWDMGSLESGTTVQALIIRRANGFSGSDIGDDGSLASRTETDSRGLFVGSRTSPTANNLYKNGAVVATSTIATPTPSTRGPQAFGIGGVIGTNSYVGTKQCAGAGIFSGLSATEVSALYTAVQKFNTALLRQV